MQIKYHLWNASTKNRRSGKTHWDAALAGFLILFTILSLMLVPFGGRAAAPGLTIGPFTTNSGLRYITVTITNAITTNTYQIDHKLDLNSNVPWVGSITGILGQTNFSIQLGPEAYMFYRALDCFDCDKDLVPNYKDADPLNSNITVLTITILSPTNGATIY